MCLCVVIALLGGEDHDDEVYPALKAVNREREREQALHEISSLLATPAHARKFQLVRQTLIDAIVAQRLFRERDLLRLFDQTKRLNVHRLQAKLMKRVIAEVCDRQRYLSCSLCTWSFSWWLGVVR